jgi:hypothetical protein
MHETVREIHHRTETMVHYRQAPVGGEHAQAVRHVVQSGIELARQSRFPKARRQRLDEDGVETEVDAPEADKEQRKQHRKADVIETAVQGQRQRHRSAREQDVQLDDQRASIISRGAPCGVADRHSHAEHMSNRIIAPGNGHKTPKT